MIYKRDLGMRVVRTIWEQNIQHIRGASSHHAIGPGNPQEIVNQAKEDPNTDPYPHQNRQRGVLLPSRNPEKHMIKI